jgi:hypothetical protein
MNFDDRVCWYQKINGEWWVVCDGIATRKLIDPVEILMAEECNKSV